MKIEIDINTLPVDIQERIYFSLKEKFELIPITGEALLDKEITFFRDFLDNRVINLLYAARIFTVRELIGYRQSELENLRGFGTLSIKQIDTFLKERGLSLLKD